MKLFARILITAIAVAVAIWLVPGISPLGANAWTAIIVAALILAVLDTFVKPLVEALSCGAVVLTFGLFLLVINALMLLLGSWISQQLGTGFVVDGFWPAFWGGIIISVVSWMLGMFISDDGGKKRRHAKS